MNETTFDKCDFAITDSDDLNIGSDDPRSEEELLLNVWSGATNLTLLSISKDWIFALGNVEMFTANQETGKITFSDGFLTSLRQQLDQLEDGRINRKGLTK